MSGSVSITAQEALERLKEGNEIYASGHYDRTFTVDDIIDLDENGQHPFAAVITCSDSRVPPELIFDCTLGEIFTIRSAGNVLSDYEIGSAEYAAAHLHTPLIVVLGHRHCGAVASCCEDHADVPGHLLHLLQEIEPSVKIAREIAARTGEDVAELAENENIRHSAEILKSNDVILRYPDVEIVMAKYDTHSGKVRFFD